MSVDTGGSAIPTLLAAFTYTNQLVSYTNLVLLACDNNDDGTGTDTVTSIQFAVTNGSNYFIVVGGVNSARGVVHLNYSLAPGVQPAPPVLQTQPQPLTVGAGTAVAMSATASGPGQLNYQWWKNSSRIRNQTNESLFFSRPADSDVGQYYVVVTNFAGSVTSAPVPLSVLDGPSITANTSAGYVVSAFPGVRGYQYGADCTQGLVVGGWANFTNLFPDYGGILWLTNSMTNNQMFFRVHTP
jgi:hypothetical protein